MSDGGGDEELQRSIRNNVQSVCGLTLTVSLMFSWLHVEHGNLFTAHSDISFFTEGSLSVHRLLI